MPNYQLNIHFSEKDIETLRASNQSVVLVKHAYGEKSSNIGWLSFKPFQNNKVKFDSNNFRNIDSDSPFQSNTNGITNEMSEDELLVFGLSQKVSINGVTHNTNSINYISVPHNQNALIPPTEKIDVFLASSVNNSTVLNHIDSNQFKLDSNEGGNTLDISYDSQKGEFKLN